MARKRTAAEALQVILASVSDEESLEDDDPDFNASLENSSDESDAGEGEEYIISSGEESEDGGDVWIDVGDEFTPTQFGFTGNAGIKANISSDTKPSDIYNLFLTDELLEVIVAKTNRYASQFLATHNVKPHSRATAWRETDVEEIRKLIGLVFLMGVVRKPTVDSYWSGNSLIATPFFPRTMPRDRFSLLLKFLHFSNSEDAPADDILFKLRQVCDILRRQIQDVYIPDREISIDESMVLWRGRLMFRQYIPSKKHKYGIKLYELCDPNGYVWNASVYCGKTDRTSGVGHSEAVVNDLISPLLDKGYHLYVDNFYTGIPLAKNLMEHQTHLCGTLRRNRKFLPQNVVKSKLKKGQVASKRSGPVVVLKWKDKRDVLMLSTMHPGRIVQTDRLNRRQEQVQKPDCILDYNKYMCGIDRSDQLASYYDPLRKTLKWYRKVVFHFLDIAMCNACAVQETWREEEAMLVPHASN